MYKLDQFRTTKMNQTIRDRVRCDGQDCFDNDYFNKKLSESQISHCSYDRIAIEQNPNFIFCFDELFKEIKPSNIIEIGTYQGACTKAVRDIMLQYSHDFRVHTFDVRKAEYLLQQDSLLNITVYHQNIFNGDYSDFADEYSRQILVDIINKNGTSCVLCDGGCKPCEFKMLSSIIKQGDYIMLHDYAKDVDIFNKHIKNKYWNWLEVQDDAIIDSCKTNNLEKVENFNTEKAAWGCFRKL